jgi:hypothetical protein
MKFLKKKVLRPFRHVYTDDDYKWIGRRKNYEVILRRFTENSITKYYFIININNSDDNCLIYHSKEENASSLNVMGLKNMALPILGIIYENS